MALSLLCGGLGVAEASVHVEESGVTYEVYTTGETYSKETANAKLDLKADKTDVATNTANIANLENNKLSKADASNTYATKADVNTELANKADKTYVDTELTKKADVTALGEYAKTADVNTELANKADQADLDTANGKITDLRNKTGQLSADGTELTGMTTVSGTTVSGDNVKAGELTVTGEIKDGAGVTTTLAKINDSMTQTAINTGDIANLKTKTDGQQTAINGLNEKTTQISYDPAEGTTVHGVKFKDAEVDANGKGLTGVSKLHTTDAATIGGALTAAGLDAGTGAITGGSLSVTGEVKGNRVDAGAGEIKTTGVVNAGTLSTAGNATVGGELNATGKVSGNGLDAKTGDIKGGSLSVTGEIKTTGAVNAGTLNTTGDATVGGDLSAKNTEITGTLHATGETKLDDKLTVKGEARFKDKVTMENGLKVKGELKTDKISMKNTDTDPDGTIHRSATTITADGITHNGEVEKSGVITKSQFTHTEEGSETYAKKGNTTNWTETRSDVKADGVSNKMTDSDKNTHTYYQTATESKEQLVNGDKSKSNFEKKTAEGNTISITEKDAAGNPKSSLTNTQTVAEEKTSVTNTDSSSTIKQGADQIRNYVASVDGTKSSTEVKADGITNTSDGTITNDANHIENKANTMNTTVTGKATESYGELETTVNGNQTTTVEGNVKEDYKHDLTTTVGGNEQHEVTGNQTNTIGGNQTTTVTGDISNTAKNITNEAKTQLTDKVGDNTRVTTSDSITDTVGTANRKIEDGKITDTAGAFTVTTDKANGTTFAKTGSTAAYSTEAGAPTDTNIAGNLIKTGRVDANELKVSDKEGDNSANLSVKAGEGVKASASDGTTTGSLDVKADEVSSSVKDASGKGSTFKQRIDAIMGNVKNNTTGEESFHKQTSDIIMDNVKDQDNSNNRTQTKTETKDIITDKDGNSSTTSQTASKNKTYLKDKDGKNTNSTIDTAKGYDKTIKGENGETSTKQDAKDITNTAKGGTIKNDANDIVNNAQETITNKAGTSITNQVNNSRVTTDANGTTFENNTAAVSDGGTTKTKINGNLINTGRVDANELKVSDKEGDNSANLSVKAGEGVKASASDGTTTGSLDVTADKVGSSVKDASGNGSTFKQRIDAIMGNVKNNTTGEESFHKQTSDIIMDNVKDGDNSNNRTQTKTETKDIITDKDGNSSTTSQTASKNKAYLKDKDGKNTNSTIDTAKGYDKTIKGENGETSTQQTDSMVQSYVGKKDGSATNVTTNFANASANQVTENGQTSTVLNNKDGLLIQNTANGTSFTTADGTNTGTAQAWTNVKGNEISTGKVEANYAKMNYADVMKDLGVHGNAKIAGKTTTGSLEVKGESKLTGNVTMENNATVGNDLTVKGITNTKTLNVTEDAKVGRNLAVDGNATIAGDVTARSYKVDGKTYIDANGIHANNQKITNVADGSISEGSKDAVNGGQLYGVKNDLEGKVNKVGANAAAMANLHPMEFDPDSKWNIAAAIGNYGSETAAAIGAFYRPNDNVMVNLSTAFGTGENMVGGGVSVRLGKGGNKLSREETNALKAQVADLTARMDALLSVLNPNMSKDFPDVPENHWAYEAVSRLAGNDIVQGYPDGEFHGERTMTRYEMAEIIYNALSRGAEAEKELVEEFKPELQAMAASEKATAERAEG